MYLTLKTKLREALPGLYSWLFNFKKDYSGKFIRLKNFLIYNEERFYEWDSRREFMRRAFKTLSFNGIDGDYLEFGSHGGITFTLAYREMSKRGPKRTLWAFDSFQGLPPPSESADEHPIWVEGTLSTSVDDFHKICERNAIYRDDYEVVPGFYDETLTNLSADEDRFPRDIALAYIDCDLYSSTRTVLEFLVDRLKHGTIIAFDDYFCYSETDTSGERKALQEFAAANPQFHFVPFFQYSWGGMSFIVEDANLAPSQPLGELPTISEPERAING